MPLGALACCPLNSPDGWTVSPAGQVSTPPGKSKAAVFLSSGQSQSCTDHGHDSFVSIPSEGANTTSGEVHLATLDKSSLHSCLSLSCGSNEQDKCHIHIVTGQTLFAVGESFTAKAMVSIYGGGKQPCVQDASVFFVGFGCAPDTLQYFLLALSCVVSGTILLGLCLEVFMHSRLKVLVDCSFSIKFPRLPRHRSLHDVGAGEIAHCALRHSETSPTHDSAALIEGDIVIEEGDPHPRMAGSDLEGEPKAIVDTCKSKPTARVLETSETSDTRGGAKVEDTFIVEEGAREFDVLLPTPSMLRQSIASTLSVPVQEVASFGAWLGEEAGRVCSIQVEFAIQTPKAKHIALKRNIERAEWKLSSKLPAPWDQALLEWQPPASAKAKGTTPGMDLLEMFERLGFMLWGGVEDEDKDSQQLHLDVAREILSSLTSRRARCLLVLQYLGNLGAAGFLPYLGYLGMTSCDHGFPMYVHFTWVAYMCFTSFMSILFLRYLGGSRVSAFCKQFRWRLLFRVLGTFILLTDTYQDATFPVIASKCHFSLWFVSAWLVILGVGVMQVVVQVSMMISCVVHYYLARMPEERDRWLVQGAFMALRGSDNFVLVYAVRPAVEERLGGASSWAMKLSEARVAFLRFIFEDVEQSALQAVFLIFYEDAAVADKIWVTASIATSLMLSFTMVVQCIPEVRDWLWHRVFSCFPGCRRFPVLRIPWLFLMLVVYRALSTFPWISACSPSGDPCQSQRSGWWEFFWGCDSNGETALFGLTARVGVVDEILHNSAIGLGIIASTILCASGIWWMRHQLAQIGKRRLLGSADVYDQHRRLAFSRSPHDKLLRPITDDDEDVWLDPARQLGASLTRLSETAADRAPLDAIRALVKAIDKNIYRISRAHIYRGSFWYPGSRWLMERAVQKQLAALIDLANRAQLDGPAMAQARHLSIEVKHVLRLSKVRNHVKNLLCSRQFIQAGLEQKAWAIIEGNVGTPPLKLIHWERIEVLGYLPKHKPDGTGNGAVHVDELLEEVAVKLNVSRQKAERQTVVFFLSHRWLQTEGRSSHHPDSEDGIKAQKLVSFARWFKGMAARAGMIVDVAFWIDYCCCEQDDSHGVELGIAALPLYIASCTKVLAWRTPDFHRRSWTMVERLLSYSFCHGGLTPYVIDETFPEVHFGTKEAVPRTDTADQIIWQVDVKGEWLAFDEPAQAVLNSAKLTGLAKTVLESQGRQYEIDLKDMTQTNKSTRKRRKIRELEVPKTAHGPKTTPSRLQKRVTTASIMGAMQTVQRMAKKLPNPLDPDTCLITRDSHRRQIASLVSVALAVPAFEVFADRQPVEWGLTEVVEHRLSDRDELPTAFPKDVPPPEDWLQVRDDSAKTSSFSMPCWKLILLDAANVHNQRQLLQSNMDAIVWVDLGFQPGDVAPDPVEIDRCFKDVDEVLDGHCTRLQQEKTLEGLLFALKTDLTLALKYQDDDSIQAAVIRARDVELPVKQDAVEHLVRQRLLLALSSGMEAEMRSALRFARERGADHLQAYWDVKDNQQRIYKERLLDRLDAAAADADITSLAAVFTTAVSYGHDDVAQQVLQAAQAHIQQAAASGSEAVMAVAALQSAARSCNWTAIESYAAGQLLRLTMELALSKSSESHDLATMRAVEQRARSEGLVSIADRAVILINQSAHVVGERMGLPAGWDVVEQLAGTEAARLLKKDEETERALLKRIQKLVDKTYWGWGGYGSHTRTRDRGAEPVATRLKVMSVVYVQNAESFVNYLARRRQILNMMTADDPVGDCWEVKTSQVPLVGVGRHKGNPVDKRINEHYLWHGCTPFGAKSITDDAFNLKLAGTSYGSLFGPGIYMAESCMKADEYTRPDERGYFPLLLCRATLGRINYCDHPSPAALSASLEASCRPAGGFHSVLGDREKVNRTFREFIMYDNHQVYAEYIVWYKRIF